MPVLGGLRGASSGDCTIWLASVLPASMTRAVEAVNSTHGNQRNRRIEGAFSFYVYRVIHTLVREVVPLPHGSWPCTT
jgi:hypothetical protein